MPSFFTNASLSRGDLPLFLRNELGYLQDGFDVRWTILKQDGTIASQIRSRAVRATTGEYYAPWACVKQGGCYTIKWEWKPGPGEPFQCKTQSFFVLDVSNFCPCPISGASDPVDCGAFFQGQVLGPDDLRISIVDDDGLPADAFAVWWTICDACGKPVTERLPASQGAQLGQYWAPWTVCGFGEFTIKWEWMLESDSPLEASCYSFSVLNPPALFFSAGTCCIIRQSPCCASSVRRTSSCGGGSGGSVIVKGVSGFQPCHCPTPSVTQEVIVANQCCDFEVARVVHLSNQVLPAEPTFTNQVAYPIPTRVRKIAFYINYTRGAPGGFAVVRLLWGNGTEETQATVLSAVPTTVTNVISAQAARLSDLVGPKPDTDDEISFMVEASVPGGSTTVRLLAAEGGVLGAPGSASITLTAASD